MRIALTNPRTERPQDHRPVVWTPSEVIESGMSTRSKGEGYDKFVPARPMNNFGSWLSRAKLAIAVFRGQADVLQWEQGQ